MCQVNILYVFMSCINVYKEGSGHLDSKHLDSLHFFDRRKNSAINLYLAEDALS
jgi:hypothetical protein